MGQSRADARTVAVMAVMIALVAVFTLAVRVPIPATGGYFNFSDVAIYFAAFTFGPWVGLAAGGVGTMLADFIGFPAYAPLSLVAHGLQGLLAGYFARGRRTPRMLLGWALGAVAMMTVYFVGELIWFGGIPAALSELPANLMQNVGGAVVGIPLTLAVRRAYPPITQIGWGRAWREV